MKYLIYIFTLLLSFSVSARKSPPTYIIKSDKPSNKIKEGECLIYGKVLGADNKPIYNATISTVNHSIKTTSDENGVFKLTISAKDSSLYLYKYKYTEIVLRSYTFKSKHEVEIDFYPKKDNQTIMVKKPVIYLYNAPKGNISLILNPKSKLTFTYPKYRNGWNITATPEGIISDGKRTYPYLFWEGEQNDLTFNINQTGGIDGFFIKTDSVVALLEQKLAHLGLNDKETTDFITFWAPSMEEKEYVYIQFIVDDSYNSNIGDLIMTPKPTSIKRVYMVYSLTKANTPLIKITEQKLPSFKRKGFTVIEWGGSEVNIPDGV